MATLTPITREHRERDDIAVSRFAKETKPRRETTPQQNRGWWNRQPNDKK